MKKNWNKFQQSLVRLIYDGTAQPGRSDDDSAKLYINKKFRNIAELDSSINEEIVNRKIQNCKLFPTNLSPRAQSRGLCFSVIAKERSDCGNLNSMINNIVIPAKLVPAKAGGGDNYQPPKKMCSIYARIIVSSILNFSSAATACGTLAGIMIISPAEAFTSWPPIVSLAWPSII